MYCLLVAFAVIRGRLDRVELVLVSSGAYSLLAARKFHPCLSLVTD